VLPPSDQSRANSRNAAQSAHSQFAKRFTMREAASICNETAVVFDFAAAKKRLRRVPGFLSRYAPQSNR
jgi:hypothetical protein